MGNLSLHRFAEKMSGDEWTSELWLLPAGIYKNPERVNER